MLVGINSANNLVGNSAVVSVMQVVKTVSSQIAVKKLCGIGSSVAEWYGEGYADFDRASPVV